MQSSPVAETGPVYCEKALQKHSILSTKDIYSVVLGNLNKLIIEEKQKDIPDVQHVFFGDEYSFWISPFLNIKNLFIY